MSIHDAEDLAEALQISRPELPFQVGNSQLKSLRELTKNFDAENQTPKKDALSTLPYLIIDHIYKLPRVEYQTFSPPKVDPYE